MPLPPGVNASLSLHLYLVVPILHSLLAVFLEHCGSAPIAFVSVPLAIFLIFGYFSLLATLRNHFPRKTSPGRSLPYNLALSFWATENILLHIVLFPFSFLGILHQFRKMLFRWWSISSHPGIGMKRAQGSLFLSCPTLLVPRTTLDILCPYFRTILRFCDLPRPHKI